MESAFRDLGHFVAEAEQQVLGICHIGVGRLEVEDDYYAHLYDIRGQTSPLTIDRHHVQRVTRWLVLSVAAVPGVVQLHPIESMEPEVPGQMILDGGPYASNLIVSAHFVDEAAADLIASQPSSKNLTDHVIDLATRNFRISQIVGNLIDFARFTVPVDMVTLTTPTYYDDWQLAWADFDMGDPTLDLENLDLASNLSFDLLLDYQQSRLRGLRLKDITKVTIPLFLDPQPDG